jgi:hypothetical protein
VSTKIYNGYRLAEGTNVFLFAEHLREVMNPIRRRLDARMLMSAAITAVDSADARGDSRPPSPLLDAMHEFRSDQRKMDSMVRGHDPHRFEVAFVLDTDANGGTGRIFCLLYADKTEFVEAWEALTEVEPHGYWNNAEQPDGVTDNEWNERRMTWARLLPGSATPIERSISFSLRAEAANDIALYDLVISQGFGSDREDARLDLLRSVAKPKRDRARNAAVDLLTREMASHMEDAGQEVNLMNVVTRIAFTRPDDDDNYEAVVDAVEGALSDDVVDFVLAPAKDTVSPVDLTPARIAAGSWIERNGA